MSNIEMADKELAKHRALATHRDIYWFAVMLGLIGVFVAVDFNFFIGIGLSVFSIALAGIHYAVVYNRTLKMRRVDALEDLGFRNEIASEIDRIL